MIHHKTTPKPLLVKALNRNLTPHPPVWLMRQAGRYLPEYRAIRGKFPDFLQFCLTPEAATEVTLQPMRRFSLDAAIIFADILTIPHALGHRVTFKEGYGPSVQPFTKSDQLKEMRAKLSNISNVLSPVSETIRHVRATLPYNQAVIGFVGGPWTLMTYLLDKKPSQGIPNLLKLIEEDPNSATALSKLLTQAVSDHLIQQVEAGADVVQIFESWAGLCPTGHWATFVHNPLIEIVQNVQSVCPNTPTVLFPRLAKPSQLQALAHEPLLPSCVGLGLGTETNMVWACQNLQPHRAIQGNLDPLLLTGAAEPLSEATAQLLATAATQPGFVFNLGHGLTPQTDPDRVAQLVAQVQNWRSPTTA